MTDTTIDSTISPVDLYRIVRSQIEHEDNLNSQRHSWFVASQSFLFTAYAIVLSNLNSARAAWVERHLHVLVSIIPMVALLTCLTIYATILAGTVAMRNLRRVYQPHASVLAGAVPPVQGYRLTQVFGQAGPLGLPPIFMATWVFLLFCRAGA